ncbi:hypothetical protein T492DRAFT_854049 [Pavlovales sp. CCMP2436]|nr:hypothetical protein T492DRAFT_854049 [Pavlovales sp. CCMP2436]
MSEGQNFSNVFLGGKDRALGALGELRADSVGIKWKSRTTGKEVKVASSDMRGLSWARVRGGNQLRVHLKGGSSLKFEGLKPADRGPIEELCRGYGQELKALALSSKGLSWGAASVEGAMIKFEAAA